MPAPSVVGRIVLAVSWLLPVLAVVAVDYLPTNDGPANAYMAFLRSHLRDPVFAAHYAPTVPVTSVGWGAAFALLEWALGWRFAYRACLGLAVGLWMLGALSIVRRLPPARLPLSFIVSAGAVQWALYMGFLPWLSGMGLGLAAFGLGARANLSGARFASIAALLACAAVTHPFGAQLGGALLFLHAVFANSGRLRIEQLVRVAGTGIAPLLVTSALVIGLADAENHPLMAGHREYYPPFGERLAGFLELGASGPLSRSLPPLLAAFAGLACGVGSSCVARLRRGLSPLDRTLLVGTVALTLCALLAPRHGAFWQNFSPRFVPPALLFGALLLPLERLPLAWARPALALAAGVALLSNGVALEYHLRLRNTSQRWLAGLGVARPDKAGTLLPIVMDAALDPRVSRRAFEIPYARPHVNTGLVYAMDRGAVAPSAFSMFPEIHLVLDRQAFPRVPSPHYFQDVFEQGPSEEAQRVESVRLASYGSQFDEVLVIGPDLAIDVFVARGYRTIHRSARLFIGAFEGCPLTLHVAGEKPEHLSVVLGWAPAERPVTIEEDMPVFSFPLDHALPSAGCGPHWLSITAQRLACKEAADDGRLHVDGPSATCTLAPASPP